MDYASVGVWDDITLTLDCTMVLYSTHSHTPENPRYRLVIPLNREVDVEEHEAIARKVASMIGINMFDDSTYQAERLMYYPSTSKDGEYVFEYREGEPLDADKVLAEYHDWRDVSQWAVSERVSSLIRHEMRKKGDPNDRPGMVGAFCRSYTIAEAIDQFLSDVYAPVPNDDNRYTYINGSSAGGLVIYNDVFAYSHHATDPAGEQLSNAFDLVRIHMFGAMDSGVSSNTPINKLPSFVEMERFASSDAKVRQNFNADISERLRSDFGDLYDDPDLDDDATTEAEDDDAWMENLTRTRTGQIENTVQNIILILENAKGLKGNLRTNNFKHSIEVKGNLPWRKINMTTEGEWTNADEARLQVYFERYYNLIGRPKILNCFTEVISAHSYHPVRDYLSSLEWDGVSRVDTLLTDYLGVPDTELNRAISRKFLVAAVARVFRPGIKFDYVTVIQGREGIGKSTLVKLLVGLLEPLSGSIVINDKCDIGYYAQEHELLDNNKNILENFKEFNYSDRDLRSFLGNFLFSGDSVFKNVGVLSPGERSRVALAKIAISGANTLILDEPTNHLDPETQEIIASTFKDYEGTMLVVSHNINFVDNLGIERMLMLPSGQIRYYDRDIVLYYQELNNKSKYK